MARIKNRKALILSAVLLAPVVFVGAVWLWWSAHYIPSNIVNFHPKDFEAKAAAEFFYSVGDELKFGDEISPQSPTLMRGRIAHFLVSPDNGRIAAVVSGNLVVVIRTPLLIRQVAQVDTIFREPKPSRAKWCSMMELPTKINIVAIKFAPFKASMILRRCAKFSRDDSRTMNTKIRN